MAQAPAKPLQFRDCGAWRAWLEAHHATAREAWLRIARRHGSRPGLALASAVEQALCYGWIDGALRPVDADFYDLRFSPRKPRSVWSAANKARAQRLQREGRMTDAGRAVVEAARASGEWDAADVRREVHPLPDDLRMALAQAGMEDAFTSWPPSLKEQYLQWLGAAKRSPTRARRVVATVDAVSKRAKAGERVSPKQLPRDDVLERIRTRSETPAEMARICASDPAALRAALAGLDAREAAVKYGCAKVLHEISRTAPGALYGHFDRFAALLDGPNKILRWIAIRILGRLAVVDVEGKLDRMLDHYLTPIAGPQLIAAANTIQGAADIAGARPHLADKIARAIVASEHGSYETAECGNVVIGHALAVLEGLIDRVAAPAALIAFAGRQRANPRVSAARSARRFVERHSR